MTLEEIVERVLCEHERERMADMVAICDACGAHLSRAVLAAKEEMRLGFGCPWCMPGPRARTRAS